MEFPPAKRVIFERRSLVEIVCQLRFSQVLRIDTGYGGFQDRVRAAGFATYERREVTGFTIGTAGGGAPVPTPLKHIEHHFGATDGGMRIVLTRDFVAVEARGYPGWTEFSKLVKLAGQAVRDEFAPTAVSRVGLRFQNLFVPTELGLAGARWSELLKPELLGMLALKMLGLDADVVGLTQALELKLTPPFKAFVQHGLVEDAGNRGYLIDSDFFSLTPTDMENGISLFEPLHDQAWRFFYWCLEPRLIEAMKPTEPAGG